MSLWGCMKVKKDTRALIVKNIRKAKVGVVVLQKNGVEGIYAYNNN